MEKEMYLALENGEVFKGKSFGAEGGAAGEVVFTTGMVGYLETLTDPSYCGQILVQTFPMIGNYGLIPSDFESQKTYLKAYIVREWCHDPSNFRCEGTIDTFLKEQGVVGLCGIDTRKLTRILRENGTMRGCIAQTEEEARKGLKQKAENSGVLEATCKHTRIEGSEKAEKTVVILDYGMTHCFSEYLLKRGMRVVIMPADSKAETVLSYHPDGILLSNGPGSAQEYPELVTEVAKLSQSGVPIFGIDLGHLILAAARGGKEQKLKHGHRGANQPVRRLATDRVYISSQNHGYTVDMEQLPENAKVTFVNLNDGTCEGLEYTDIPAISVQFRPGDGEDKLDTGFLFDQFINMMEGKVHAAE